MDDPDYISESLTVQALVVPVKRQSVQGGDWFLYRTIQVRLLGLQAWLHDMQWGAMVKKPKGTKPGECPSPLFLVAEDEAPW